MSKIEFEFVTDTATLCVFDIAALKHRLTDDCDWWSIPEDEVAEVNNGNAAFVGLGGDGKFTVEVSSDQLESNGQVVLLLSCPSGRVFVGAGEEVTGEGFEPEAIRGGTFTTVEPGNYRLAICRVDGSRILLHLAKHAGPAVNHFSQPLRI